MAPLQPFCLTSRNGVVYAVSFAYDAAYTTESSYPDRIVLLSGSTINGQRQNMSWAVLSSNPRTQAGIFPDTGIPYTHVCGVSRDGSLFILHSTGLNQVFSVHIPVVKDAAMWVVQDTYYNSSFTQESASWARGPSLLLPTADFSTPPQAFDPKNDDMGDWMHLHSLNQHDLAVSRSNNGFPLSPQTVFPEQFQMSGMNAIASGIAYANKTLFLLSTMENSASVRIFPFEYNTSNPNWFDINSKGTEVGVAGPCTYRYSAIGTMGNLAFVLCSTSYTNPEDGAFTIINSTDFSARVTVSIPKSASDTRGDAGSKPVLVPFSSTNLMLADGSNLFWITMDGRFPTMNLYTLAPMKRFTSDNQNPDMTSEPLTFSGTDTFGIVVGFLVLAVVMVWVQRLFFKWRASRWVDADDIPGSKVAEDVQDPSLDQGPSDGHPPLSRYVPPTYSETDSIRNNSHKSVVPLTEVDSRSPRFGADELELMPFSSHPRPNVVTTITDGSSEDTPSHRE
ncbi:hypothetical protein EMPS_09738 [Entomortierella parvispora]|uniref:Uncharacterized protein n=1 Tax=Entomortierella parvispora TaxID=205924 RepID=A0A9P3M0J7_9FUNG|nr:hypothetical protein EMPS_09738 [Entomortierella parvispora]